MSPTPPTPPFRPPTRFRYVADERCPVEILVFRVDESDVDEFLRVDHEIWTLGEAAAPGFDEIPFLSKEVWLNDERPGEITITFTWPNREHWDRVDDPGLQTRLTELFEERFDRPYELIREVHTEERHGIHRWSRFERSG